MRSEFPQDPKLVAPQQEEFRIFRNVIGQVTTSEIEALQPSLESVLHVIRHLQSISSKVEEKLIGQKANTGASIITIDHQYLATQLRVAGSKFHKIIDDPWTVIDLCCQRVIKEIATGKSLPWYEDTQAKVQTALLTVRANAAEKQALGIPPNEFLGNVGVVEINDKLAPYVQQELRGEGEVTDRIPVNVIKGCQAPETDDYCVYLVRSPLDHACDFGTAYTGVDTPSLPRTDDQTAEEFAYNQQWWNRYAFVVPDAKH